MKQFSILSIFLIIIIHFFAFSCNEKKTDPPKSSPPSYLVDIDLEKIANHYIDLSAYKNDTVYLSGDYKGDRLVFKNTSNLVMVFNDCSIQSTHPEDAIVFDGLVEGLELISNGLDIKGGGITFWGMARNVDLAGGTIRDTHTGIRATGDRPHQNIFIHDWTINHTSHEGIYLGVSKDTNNDCSGFVIYDNKISNTGWDAIQVGNCNHAVIYNNEIDNAGSAKTYGQDYGITVNPGSLVYIYENVIINTPKPIQVLDSRAFFHLDGVR